MRRHTLQLTNHAVALSKRIKRQVALFYARVRGQGLVEYGLILVIIMVVCIGLLAAIGTSLSGVWYNSIVNNPAW